jgi:hypothetical protein
VRIADLHRLPFTVSSVLKFLQLWAMRKGCPSGVFVRSSSRTKPCLAPISSCRSLVFVPFCEHTDQAQDSFVFLFPALLCIWSQLLSFGSLSPCTWRLDAVVQLRDRAKTLAPGRLPSHGSFLLFTGSRADSSARLVLALIFVFLSHFSNHARPGHTGLRPQSSLSRA